jgi:Ca-activated chloride channel family protein
LNTEKFSSRLLDDVSVRIELDTRRALKSVYCPSHSAEIKRNGDTHAVIGWEARSVRPDTDFKLVFSTARDLVGIDLLTHRDSGEEGYFLMLASPGQVSKSEIQPKNIVFVIDTSGSMARGKLEQAKKALRFCLENLSVDDHFDIVRFSTESEPLFGELVRADRKNIDKAASFVETLKPMGGTALASALDKATSMVAGTGAGHSDTPSYILFMTDGLPTVGETREDAIIKHLDPANHCRVFTLGVGNDVNTNLLDRIASTTRAVSQYVLPKEDLEIKLSNLYDKIRQPVLTNLSLKVDGVTVSKLYPTDLPDLFNGDMLVLFGRYHGSGNATITLSGNLAGQRKQFVEEVRFPESSSANDYVPRLWATRRVGWLLDEIRLHGESSELKDEVIQLARTHGIVTPYTSYLIMEDEARHNVPLSLRSAAPAGADRDTMDFARGAFESAKAEAKDSAARTGARAVDNAQRIDMMKSSWNAGQIAQSAPVATAAPMPTAGPVGYKQQGQNQGMLQNARVVNGRSFYQNGNTWVDANAQMQRNLKQKEVKLGSDEYFALLKSNPNMPQWLSVGSEVDIVIGETLYQIR